MRTVSIALFASALTLTACKSELDDKPAAAVKDAPAPAEADPAAPTSQAHALALDPAKSRVGFVGAKVTGDHEGTFGELEGKAVLAGDEVQQLEVAVAIPSLAVEPAKLREHLLSADFFDAEKHPEAKFVSTVIRPAAAGEATHEVEGQLTLRGVTKTITFPAKITVADDAATGSAEFKINRKDFEIVYPGMPDDLIKDEVLLQLELVAPRRDPAT